MEMRGEVYGAGDTGLATQPPTQRMAHHKPMLLNARLVMATHGTGGDGVLPMFSYIQNLYIGETPPLVCRGVKHPTEGSPDASRGVE